MTDFVYLEVPTQPAPIVQAFAVGAIYETVDPINPASSLGYGTWVAWGAGRASVGFLALDPDFGAVEATGGSKTSTVADHVHHTHDVTSNATTSPATVQSGTGATVVGSATNGTATSTVENPTLVHVDGVTGLSTIKTMSPFIVSYKWKRTA